MAVRKNHYKTLGISPDADERQIRAAYRNLAKKYHPDAGEGASAENFRAVQEAYEFLGDTEKRKEYDSVRSMEIRTPVRRSVHLDLREIMRKRTYGIPEPNADLHEIPDSWEELIDFLFRRF
jgi:curved DNA-binding protein CbpA